MRDDNKRLAGELERMKSQEPVAWARYPRFTGSLIKQEVVFIKPEGTNWTELYAAPPDLAAKVAELQEKLIEAEDGAGYHAQWSREFKSQLDAAKGRISELTEQVKVAKAALKVARDGIDEFLVANDPTEFGCACDLSVGYLCGPCHADMQQEPLKIALAKINEVLK